MSAGSSAPSRWLFGPIPDLFLGCGLAYMVIFLILCMAGPELRTVAPLALIPLFSLFTSSPHYGATLLRVYERREERRAYAIFAVWLTVALAGMFLWGLQSALVGSWILTVYLTWSPWHYSGQNYGITMMFLRRRGIPTDDRLQRLLYTSFLLSFLLTFFALHGQDPVTSYAPQGISGEVFQLRPLGISGPWLDFGMSITGLAYAGVILTLALQLLRRAPARDLIPVGLLIGMQALWFSAPALSRHWGLLGGLEPFSVEHAGYAFVWIATGHAIQYLWITAYYARTSGRADSNARFYLKALLAGVSLWTLPALLFAPGLLGQLPYDAGLGVLVASMVNLHHFILDGAIWKLRDGRIASILIRSVEAPAGPDARRHVLAWGLIGAGGILSVVVTVTFVVEDEWGFRRAFQRGDLARAEKAVERLVWVGHDSPEYHFKLGREHAKDGDFTSARTRIDQSLALQPTFKSLVLSARLHEADRNWQAAADDYTHALTLDPLPATVNYRAGLTWLEVGDVVRARPYLRNAVRLAPNNPKFLEALGRAQGAITDAPSG
ncbi:tetratricopeptide repeat protein [Myxococcota bacterium]|nr:tetratricopeptide repeat protein [Myxococcota bacterium]